MSYDPNDTRARKVYTALEGQDEFSVFSIDPDMRKAAKKVELDAHQTATGGAPESAPTAGLFMRVFRKMFR